MIQTRNTLYACEIKFQKRVPAAVMREVADKLRALPSRTPYSTRPILIHEGELAPGVRSSDFFCRMITGHDLLTGLSG